MNKGQQQAVSAVLISGILIGIVGSVYFWGVPLIQKSRSANVLQNSEDFMFTLDEKIRNVATTGNRETLRVYESGVLQLSGGRLFYRVATDGSIYAANADIPLGTTTNCDDTKDGEFGKEGSTVFCVLSNEVGESQYENTYLLSYRTLTSNLKVYNLNINGAGAIGGVGSTVVLENQGITETTDEGKDVITINIGLAIV